MVKTETDLIRIISEHVRRTSPDATAKRLGVAPVYLLQVLTRRRAVSKKIAARLGYKPVKQPRREFIFEPVTR